MATVTRRLRVTMGKTPSGFTVYATGEVTYGPNTPPKVRRNSQNLEGDPREPGYPTDPDSGEWTALMTEAWKTFPVKAINARLRAEADRIRATLR